MKSKDIHIVKDYYLKKLKPLCKDVVVAGSIRRGVDTPGDIDFLVIAKKDWNIRNLPIDHLQWAGEKKIGFIYAGFHIDIVITTKESWGAALLYFTGSGVFNIKMRKRAIAMGMKLNEYALTDVRDGMRIASRSEVEIFQSLLLKYIPPESRTDKVNLSDWLLASLRKGVRV